jgi:hypothetical protein
MWYVGIETQENSYFAFQKNDPDNRGTFRLIFSDYWGFVDP